jgi:hypothetical protein
VIWNNIYILQEKSETHNKPYVATFHTGLTELDISYSFWEKGLPSWSIACQLIDLRVPTQFLSPNSHWSSRFKPSICWWTCYIGLLGTYLLYLISTFNTCSWVPTPQSLTDTDEGYNLGGLDFPKHSLRPSRPRVLCFPLKVSSGLKLNNLNMKPPK